MASICTPRSAPGEGTPHPARGQWGHHPVPTGDTRSGPTPETAQGWGILGVTRPRGTTEPPVPGIAGDTSLPARCHEAGKQLRLRGLGASQGQTTSQPGSVLTSPARAAVYPDLSPNCWGPASLRHFGDGWGRLTLQGLGSCVGSVSLGQWHGVGVMTQSTAPGLHLSEMHKPTSPALHEVSWVVTVTS